jgi:hypothetical protein
MSAIATLRELEPLAYLVHHFLPDCFDHLVFCRRVGVLKCPSNANGYAVLDSHVNYFVCVWGQLRTLNSHTQLVHGLAQLLDELLILCYLRIDWQQHQVNDLMQELLAQHAWAVVCA